MEGNGRPGPVAFVGLGHMGGRMSRRLAEAGLDLTVFDLDAARAAPALERGARLARSAADAARGTDVLVTMLPTPAAVEQVMLEDGGALDALPTGALWIDMSTSSPAVGERVRGRAAGRIRCLDAPVAGMSSGAEAGTLEIFVGGDPADVERARPLLEHLGDPQRIFHVGGNGAGYVVKLLLNLLWFDQLVAVAEVLAIGARSGVDLGVLHTALSQGPTASRLLERDLLPLLRDGDYEEGFSMALATKDLRLAVDLARSAGVPAELSAVVEQVFTRARAVFGDEAGEMTPVRLYEQDAGVLLRLPLEGAAAR
ncbi:MAG: NAD(P)-dependent oxidoreductase [Actinobacteria bacterium]|nr:NAD(P)-dependent oxidoreductase [Actinomycetota bacterium]